MNTQGSDIYWVVSSGFYFTIPVGLMIYASVKSEWLCDKIYDLNVGKRVIDFFLVIASLSPYAYLIHVPMINFVHGIYKRIGEVNQLTWCLISLVLTMTAAICVKRIKDNKTV